MSKRVRVLSPLRLAVMALFLTASQAPAAYQPVVVLKGPFASEHTDSRGNAIKDSLVRRRKLLATLHRTGMSDSLTIYHTDARMAWA